MSKDECIYLLQELTGKDFIIFTRRGNSSISNSLEVSHELGKELVMIQDQGGWMTYEKLIKKHGLNCLMLKTNYGLIKPSHLSNCHDSVLLINSMPAYAFLEDMKSIELEAEHNKILILNDASGSIGTDAAKIGDVIFGSFGNAKPINVGEGGFIATSDKKLYSMLSSKIAFNPLNQFFIDLENNIRGLKKRLNFLNDKRDDTLKKLSDENFDVIYPDAQGINIIVRTNNNDSEKERIIKFCEKENLEFTECPRYIRVNEPAISIEIKRLKE